LSGTHKDTSDSSSPLEPAERRFDSCLWMTVRELVTTDLVTVQDDTSIEEILSLFGKHIFHIIPVVNRKNELTGIIDLDTILEILLSCFVPREKYTHLTAIRSLGTKAKDIMITYPISISLNSTIKDTSELMMKYRLDQICVIENRKLVGIVSKRDIVEEIYRRRENGEFEEK
jgi:CBS domain-containing protein